MRLPPAALLLLAFTASQALARPSGEELLQVLTPTHKGVAPAHPHVNVIVLFGSTPDGATPDPATFRARLNGRDVTGRFTTLADGELGGASGLRANLEGSELRLDGANRLKLRVRGTQVAGGARPRKAKDKERVRFTAEPRANEPPLARASADSDLIFPGVPIRFDAGTSTDPELDPLTFTWNFGDGGTADGAAAEHTYASGVESVDVAVAVSDGTESATATLALSTEPTIGPGRTKGVLRIDANGPLEFGGVPLATDASRTLTVTNTDPTATSELLVRASVSDPAFTIEPADLDLGPNESATLDVRFAPSVAGHAHAVVSLVASASNRTTASLLAHGHGGAALGSGPTLAARTVFHAQSVPPVVAREVRGIRPDGSRFFADNVVHACTVPGGGTGNGDACLVDADCAVHGGTCNTTVSVLLDTQDLCADPEGNLVVLSTDGAVTDPDPGTDTRRTAALLRVTLDGEGRTVEKRLVDRVTGETSNLACDEGTRAARGRVYVAEYFDVDSDTCDRTERERLNSVRKDGRGTNELEDRLDSIQGLDACDDLEDPSAALATRGTGEPLFVSFDFGGVWRFDDRRPFLVGVSDPEPLAVHPDGAMMFAAADATGTRSTIALYKVSESRVGGGPRSLASLAPCATVSVPNNDGRAFVYGIAVGASAADPDVAIALVSFLVTPGGLADVADERLAVRGTAAFTVPAGGADTCSALGLVNLDALEQLSF